MTISSRTRRVTAIAATVLALGLGRLVAAAPAYAGTQVSASSHTGASPDATPQWSCEWNVDYATVTGYQNISFPTTPGVYAFLIPVGDLAFDKGGAVNCNWTNGLSTTLVLQGTDGNFVFYNNSNGKKWGAGTQPSGYTAAFQGDANLVVRNAAGKAIWASNTHTYPNAVLAFQSDGNLVIYNHYDTANAPVYQPLWATGTE